MMRICKYADVQIINLKRNPGFELGFRFKENLIPDLGQ